MTSAEIITIGTEILLGEIVDTNTRYLAKNLRALGVNLFRTTTIGDNVDRIAEAIRDASERAEIVITTGGLGPTIDDPTREAVAKAVGVETEFREDLWAQVVETIARYGRTPSENQKRQAYVPKGSIGLKNPVGTAPCFIVEKNNKAIISLPGVPLEMEHVLHESVIPYLQKKFNLNEIIKVRVLHCAGLGEGMIDEKIADLEALSNPTVGLAAHTGVVDVRITAKAADEKEADELIAKIESDVRSRLGSIVFGVDEDKLEDITFGLLERKGLTLTVVQSGLDEAFARKLKAASFPDLKPDTLRQTVSNIRTESKSDLALGMVVFPEERVAELALISPSGEKTNRIAYGGPPRSFPRWTVNLTLNWLRMTLEDLP